LTGEKKRTKVVEQIEEVKEEKVEIHLTIPLES
jgi:hypothetical protein